MRLTQNNSCEIFSGKWLKHWNPPGGKTESHDKLDISEVVCKFRVSKVSWVSHTEGFQSTGYRPHPVCWRTVTRSVRKVKPYPKWRRWGGKALSFSCTSRRCCSTKPQTGSEQICWHLPRNPERWLTQFGFGTENFPSRYEILATWRDNISIYTMGKGFGQTLCMVTADSSLMTRGTSLSWCFSTLKKSCKGWSLLNEVIVGYQHCGWIKYVVCRTLSDTFREWFRIHSTIQ